MGKTEANERDCMTTREELKQTHRAIAAAMLAQDERPAMTPERLLEIRQTAQLDGGTKVTKKQSITESQQKAVARAISEFDFQWWFQRKRINDARREISKHLGFAVSALDFSLIRKQEGVCQWFKVQKRPRTSTNRLRWAVRSQAERIQGRTLDEAVAVVSLVVRCNASVLEGLASDLHLWNKQ